MFNELLNNFHNNATLLTEVARPYRFLPQKAIMITTKIIIIILIVITEFLMTVIRTYYTLTIVIYRHK